MKRYVSLILIVIMLVPLFAIPAEAETKRQFFDDFENGLSQWTTDSRVFKIQSIDGARRLVHADSSGINESFAVAEVVLGDFALRLDMTFLSGGQAGVLLRYSSSGEYYLLRFDVSENSVLLLKRVNGGKYDLITRNKMRLDLNKAYSVEAIVSGNDFMILIDGEQILNCSDSSIIRGKIGVWGRNCQFAVDNVAADTEITAGGNLASAGFNSVAPRSALPEMRGKNSKEIYEQLKAELPEEIPLMAPVSVIGDGEIFVALNGDDKANDGSVQRPFKTLERALSEISFARARGAKKIVIYMREGSYPVQNTINIGAVHSGTEKEPLVISSYPGEKVSFVGGFGLSGDDFKPVTAPAMLSRLGDKAKENVVYADLKAIGITDYGILAEKDEPIVYVHDEKMTLARYPNSYQVPVSEVLKGATPVGEADWAAVGAVDTGMEIRVHDPVPYTWKEATDIWVRGTFMYEWSIRSLLVDKIDPVKKTVSTVTQDGWGTRPSPHNTYYYYNVFEELDSPGEYYIDRSEGRLYFYPFSDAADIDMLVSIASNDLLKIIDAECVVINGITFEGTAGSAIVMENSRKCVVQNSIVRNCGGYGITLDRTYDCAVIGNTVYSTDLAGINLLIQYQQRHSFIKDLVPQNNVVQNNFVYNTNNSKVDALIRDYDTFGNIISHNLLSHSSRDAIRLMGKETVIEYNEIVGGPNVVHDMGGVYTTGMRQFYSQVRYNYIHDRSPHITSKIMGPAIYFDTGAMFLMAYGNIIQSFPVSVFLHGGRDNAMADNLILDTKKIMMDGWAIDSINLFDPKQTWGSYQLFYEPMSGAPDGGLWNTYFLYFQNPLWQKRYPNAYEYVKKVYDVYLQRKEQGNSYKRGGDEDYLLSPANNVYINNVFISDANNPITELGAQTAYGWETTKKYPHGTDIGFVDMENNNLALKEDAQVYKDVPGFAVGKFKRMGLLQENGMWTELPRLTEMLPIKPTNQSEGVIEYDNADFKWTSSIGADYYKITIANDEALTDVVETAVVTYPEFSTELGGYGKTYYWQVEAVTSAKSMADKSLLSPVWKFTTMTVEEATKYVPVDTYALQELCGRVELFISRMVEGTEQGQYKEGAKTQLTSALRKTSGEVKDIKLKTEAERAYKELETAYFVAQCKVNYGYVYLDDFDRFNWDLTINPVDRLTNSDGELIISSVGDGIAAYVGRQTQPGDILCFKMRWDNLTSWMGMLSRWDYLNQKRKYWNIVQNERFDLQKSQRSVTAMQFLNLVPNNSEIVKSDTWYDVRIGSIATEQGVWNIFMIDDTVITSYLDTDDPIYDDGWLSMDLRSANGPVRLKATDRRHDKLPEFPTEPGVPVSN